MTRTADLTRKKKRKKKKGNTLINSQYIQSGNLYIQRPHKLSFKTDVKKNYDIEDLHIAQRENVQTGDNSLSALLCKHLNDG